MRQHKILHESKWYTDRLVLRRMWQMQKWLGKSEVRVFEHQADDLYGRLLRRINESAIKVSTVRTPHQYMSAVGTKELDRILKEEFGIQPKDGVT